MTVREKGVVSVTPFTVMRKRDGSEANFNVTTIGSNRSVVDADWPTESVAVRRSSRCHGYPWSGAEKDPDAPAYPQIDQWAEQQQTALDPEARKLIWRKMWDREMEMAYRPPMANGVTFQVYQPWLRGIRWTGTSPGDNSHYYSWGSQVAHGWLDK